MTALAPVEESEVTRFGMFDAEAIGQINLDDEPACQKTGCGASATVRLHRLCTCNSVHLACTKCMEAHRARVEKQIAANPRPRCPKCKFYFPPNATFHDIYRVFPL